MEFTLVRCGSDGRNVSVCVFLSIVYHIALVPHVKQRTSRNSIAPELLSHPINNPSAEQHQEQDQSSSKVCGM